MITAAKKLKGSDGKIGGLQHLAGAPEVEESDEERELTNLNWLLRNQNLSWPKTIDANSEDDVNGQVGSNRSLSTAAAEGVNAQKKPKALEYDTLKHMTNKSCPDSRKSSAATAPLKRPSPAERYDIFINKIKRDLVEYEKSANTYKTDVTHKPPFNYSHIIGMAMLENGRVTLQQICAWIEAKFAFFRVRKKWNIKQVRGSSREFLTREYPEPSYSNSKCCIDVVALVFSLAALPIAQLWFLLNRF